MPILKRKNKSHGDGLVLFEVVQDAMKAERVLQKGGYSVRLVAPPPEMRKGCDLAVEIKLVEQPGVERLLRESNVAFIETRPMKVGTSEILEIVRVTDFGNWVMVKAANMKLTYEKSSGKIVNTSGGGCPDIPVMHAELLDKGLDEAPNPASIGYTLCSLMLDRALGESRTLWKGSKES